MEESKKEVMGFNEIIDLLENFGIMSEVNRTFFHPLGLEIGVNYKDCKVEFSQSKDEEITFDRIDKLRQGIFRAYAEQRHNKRYKKLGFLIQTGDLYRSKELKQVEKALPYKMQDSLEEQLNNFFVDIFKMCSVYFKSDTKTIKEAIESYRFELLSKLNDKEVGFDNCYSLAECAIILYLLNVLHSIKERHQDEEETKKNQKISE